MQNHICFSISSVNSTARLCCNDITGCQMNTQTMCVNFFVLGYMYIQRRVILSSRRQSDVVYWAREVSFRITSDGIVDSLVTSYWYATTPLLSREKCIHCWLTCWWYCKKDAVQSECLKLRFGFLNYIKIMQNTKLILKTFFSLFFSNFKWWIKITTPPPPTLTSSSSSSSSSSLSSSSSVVV